MYPFYACYEWHVVHMNQTKSHKFIYECILFFVKKIQICVVIKKKKFDLGLEKIRSVYLFIYLFLCIDKMVFGKESQICVY